MNIALINGSPRLQNSNSALLLNMIEQLLPLDINYLRVNVNNNVTSTNINELEMSDIWIIASPLYVDGIPSHFLSFMKSIELQKLTPKKIYVIVNCGFYEGVQNNIAIKMFESWCRHCSFTFNGAIGVGAGEMLRSISSVPLNRGPKKNLGVALNKLSNAIINDSSCEVMNINLNFPRFAYKFVANKHWVSIAKRNGLKKVELYKK